MSLKEEIYTFLVERRGEEFCTRQLADIFQKESSNVGNALWDMRNSPEKFNGLSHEQRMSFNGKHPTVTYFYKYKGGFIKKGIKVK